MSESAWQSRAELPPLFRPELVIGAATPLWGYFTGAAIAGMAFWSFARLARPEGFAAVAETVVETELAVVAEAAAEAEAVVESVVEAVVDAAVEPAVVAAAELAGGPVGDALAAEELPAFPVGGEAAPFGAATLEAELASDPEPAADLTPDAPAPRPAPRARKPREAGEAKPN